MFSKGFFPPDDKILGLSKLKAFADDKLNVTQNIKVVFHRIENIVGKNAGYQVFSSFPTMFSKGLFPPVLQKSSLCDKGLIYILREKSLASFFTSSRRNRFLSGRKLGRLLRNATGTGVCDRTVRNRLLAPRLKACRPYVDIPLT